MMLAAYNAIHFAATTELHPHARAGFRLLMELGNGRIRLFIDNGAAIAYIQALWPYSGKAMRSTLDYAAVHGWVPVPEEESEPEVQPDNSVRIYLEEISVQESLTTR